MTAPAIWRYAVGFGANQGDAAAMFRAAAAGLHRFFGVAEVRCSRLFRTAAVGAASAGDYVNGCLLADSAAPPIDFFAALQQLETQLGRTRSRPWAPRTVDLDLLLAAARMLPSTAPGATPPPPPRWRPLVIGRADCLVPHPRLHQRRFALAPLAELWPDALHPLLPGWTVGALERHAAKAAPLVTEAADLDACSTTVGLGMSVAMSRASRPDWIFAGDRPSPTSAYDGVAEAPTGAVVPAAYASGVGRSADEERAFFLAGLFEPGPVDGCAVAPAAPRDEVAAGRVVG